MEQKKTADHPASDRPRSPATEARIKEKNRRILMTVSLFVFLAAGNFLMRENDRWKLRETTVIPTAVIVEGKTTDQAQSDKEDTSPLSVEEKIFAEPSKYPSSFLDALRRNPEIADFVAAYPDTEQKAFGGIRESELPEKVPLFYPVGQTLGLCALRTVQCGDFRMRAHLSLHGAVQPDRR